MDWRLGIAGSGAIACGLARAASERMEVVLRARSEGSAARVRDELGGSARVVTDIEELRGCEVLVESVVEDAEVKRELLGRLGAVAGEDALVATTTSALPVQELARASGRPERFAAVHVFNPVEKMELVELCFPSEASEQTRDRFRAFCERLGKTVVEVPDAAGFVVNRLLFPYLFHAVRLLETDRLTPQDVDTCMTLGAGHPMGPLALLDFVGLDVAAAIGEAIGAEVPARLRELIAEGRLGKKAGAGFYDYR